MQQPELFTPLTQGPLAVTITVRNLLQKVSDGEIRIPKFQRPLRWTRDQVVQLLDSVFRGYPIGSLLFWKRPAEADSVQVGGARVAAPAVADAWWVVDGQQRIAALAASLLNLDHAGDSRWVVRFNAQSRTFESGPVEPARQGLDVPLGDLGDLRRLGRWFRQSALDDELMSVVEEAQQRILDYSIPAYLVDTEDEQALRGIFARLNSTGARMRADEVFQALLGAPSQKHQDALDLEALQQVCNRDGFGVPPRSEILKAVLAMSGLDPSRRLESLVGSGESLQGVSFEAAQEALSRTIHFLQSDCGIHHVRLLPYPVVFFILTRWFHLFPNSAPETLRLLARWLWRGAATGVHQRAEVSKMRHQIRDIRPQQEQASLNRLLQRVSRQNDGSWKLSTFDARGARSRVEILALLAAGPRDRMSLIPLGELLAQDRMAREVLSFAQSNTDLARTAANRVLLTTTHSRLEGELKRWDWSKDQQALESHLIDQQSFAALCEGKREAFLESRSQRVVAAVETFLAARAGWNEPDLRPAQVYLDL